MIITVDNNSYFFPILSVDCSTEVWMGFMQFVLVFPRLFKEKIEKKKNESWYLKDMNEASEEERQLLVKCF